MLTVTRKYTFDSAHNIPGFPDDHRCRNMHGHTYVLHVAWCIRGTANVVPFEDVDPKIREIVDLVDHRCWNDVVPEGTLELFAPWFWGKLHSALRTSGLDLVSLRLCEGKNSEVAIDDRGVPTT